MVDSRCGLHCTGCAWKESHGCGGCIETMGHPFYGTCPIALCCQEKGCAHCGECDIIPCGALYAYSYLDPTHGDKPPGARVAVCRRWAAEDGKHAWGNVLLTADGWRETAAGGVKQGILSCFLRMLGRPAHTARVLLISDAAGDATRPAVQMSFQSLISAGILPEHITTYDGNLSAGDAMVHDAVYLAGGNPGCLLRRLKETGFDAVVKRMVYANKVYVGAGAGSLIAAPNIGPPHDPDTAGLCLLNAYLSIDCSPGAVEQTWPLPHIPPTDSQALAVRWDGYCIVER